MLAKSFRADVTVQVIFKRPIFAWRTVPERFFAAIHEVMIPKFNVSTRDFAVANTNVVGELWARFSLFGGNNTITLFSDRLTIQFNALTASDYSIANDISRLAHDAFVGAFPELEAATMEYRTLEHLELVGQSSSSVFFDQFAPTKLIEAAAPLGGVLETGLQFRHTSSDQKAVFSCLAERSVLSVSAVFLVITASVMDVDAFPTFDQKYQRLSILLGQCLQALRLEMATE